MYWQEETPKNQFQVTDDILDVLYSIDCRELPVDHAYALSEAIRGELNWLDNEDDIGIHSVHVAGSQNGWERPDHGTDQRILLSRRTKLTIRLSKSRLDDLYRDLNGKTLDINGCPLTLGKYKLRLLSKQTTLFARYVAVGENHDENEFLHWAAAELKSMGIQVRKALCGKTIHFDTPDGPLATRSLMLADLSLEESLQLQQRGLGSHRHMGCGIFIPHKGIDAVKKVDDE